MRLVLDSGYPYPMPEDFDSDTHDCRSHIVVLHDVVNFEWIHTVTIEFSNFEAYERAQQLSGCWMPWSYLVLEAVVSAEDGYEHPAIVFGNKAFCGFRLLD